MTIFTAQSNPSRFKTGNTVVCFYTRWGSFKNDKILKHPLQVVRASSFFSFAFAQFRALQYAGGFHFPTVGRPVTVLWLINSRRAPTVAQPATFLSPPIMPFPSPRLIFGPAVRWSGSLRVENKPVKFATPNQSEHEPVNSVLYIYKQSLPWTALFEWLRTIFRLIPFGRLSGDIMPSSRSLIALHCVGRHAAPPFSLSILSPLTKALLNWIHRN